MKEKKQKSVKGLVIALVLLLVLGLGAMAGIILNLSDDSSSSSSRRHRSDIASVDDDDDDNRGSNDITINPTATEKPVVNATATPTPRPVEQKGKTFTLMVYMVGSNLESGGGHATRQLQEILNANPSDNVNIIIQTGGSTTWQNKVMKGGQVQRFSVKNKKLYEQKNLGKVNMAKQATLQDFISWGKTNYPADRYAICLFNHGGSASGGYGNDEVFNMNSMSLDAMERAFAGGGVHFDFIGFDCCMMSNLETAYILSKHADYLVASESVSYIYYGFQYTEFINKIVRNTSIDTLEICKTIADEFAAANNKLKRSVPIATHTIAVTDLSKVDALYKSMINFMAELDGYLLDGKSCTNIANIRYHSKYYGTPDSDLIDLSDFVSKCKIKTTNDVLNKLKSAVVYSKTDVTKSCGLGMYVPYNNLSNFTSTYNSIKPYFNDTRYLKYLYDMANLMAYNSTNAKDKKYSWYDASIGKKCMGSVTPISNSNKIEFARNQSGIYEWKLENGVAYKLADCAEQVYVDVNGKLLYLGTRDTSSSEVGSIKLQYDSQWFTINNTLVPVFYQGRDQKIDSSEYTYSYIPATLTKKDGRSGKVNLVVYFDYGDKNGKIIGYQNRNAQFDMLQQSAESFEVGDTINISYIYVDNNLNITNETSTGLNINYTGSEIKLEYKKLPSGTKYYYRKTLHDYFGRTYYSTLVTNSSTAKN